MTTIADLQSVLREMVVYGSAAILLVLILRQPLRRAFGSGAAYLLWALVRISMIAASLHEVTVLPRSQCRTTRSGQRQVPLAFLHRNPQLLWSLGSAQYLGDRRAIHGVPAGLASAPVHTFVGPPRCLRRAICREECAGLPAVIGILRPRIDAAR